MNSSVLDWVYFYRPQTKFAKVMFLQVLVCPWGRGLGLCLGGLCPGGLRRGGWGGLCLGGLCQGTLLPDRDPI